MHEPTDKLNPEECEYPSYVYFEFNRKAHKTLVA